MSRSKDIKGKVATILKDVQPADPASARKPAYLKTLIAIALIIVTISIYGAYRYFTKPYGEITTPEDGTVTSRMVDISGYTKNITEDRKYLWLVVDVEDMRLCWPKRPIQNVNGLFNIKIYEGGPNKNFVVSLYALSREYNEDIKKWFEVNRVAGREAGLDLLPADYRLDSVTLTLENI